MVQQYISFVKELKEKTGYIERRYWPPSRSQHELVMRLASQNDIDTSQLQDVLKYKESCEAFIAKYKKVYTTVGECPECKKAGRAGEIKEYDTFFGCTNFKQGCGFKLWKNPINKMFTTFKKPQGHNELFSMIKTILEGDSVIVENLISSQGNVFSGRFVIEKENNYWNLKMKFTKGRRK
jgi:hypothetical protein